METSKNEILLILRIKGLIHLQDLLANHKEFVDPSNNNLHVGLTKSVIKVRDHSAK